jgi:3,4-dihydroxy 2-butanone 4-phosphate synthase/GTP cyclohydrolase II
MSTAISSTQEILADIKAGRMVVLVDEEDRENEGDLLMAAEFVTPDAVNFMARFGRGLICLTLTEERCRQLDLPLMVGDNRSRMGTNFTLSIEAASGVTTGISAADRETRRRCSARPYFPVDGAQGRRAGACRAYRGRLRSGATRRAGSGSGHLRSTEG